MTDFDDPFRSPSLESTGDQPAVSYQLPPNENLLTVVVVLTYVSPVSIY